MLGCSVGNLKSKLYKAKMRIRECWYICLRLDWKCEKGRHSPTNVRKQRVKTGVYQKMR